MLQEIPARLSSSFFFLDLHLDYFSKGFARDSSEISPRDLLNLHGIVRIVLRNLSEKFFGNFHNDLRTLLNIPLRILSTSITDNSQELHQIFFQELFQYSSKKFSNANKKKTKKNLPRSSMGVPFKFY